MSTGHSIQLMQRELNILRTLITIDAELIEVLRQQIVQLQSENDMYRDGETKIETMNEEISVRIESICGRHELGTHGSPVEQLSRISDRIAAYEKRIDSLTSRAPS